MVHDVELPNSPKERRVNAHDPVFDTPGITNKEKYGSPEHDAKV